MSLAKELDEKMQENKQQMQKLELIIERKSPSSLSGLSYIEKYCKENNIVGV